MNSETDKDPRLTGLINLADASLGAQALSANDEFFAAKERMLNPDEPVARPNTYDDHGQWMDGWETRRRREEGHDHCIVRLAYPGVVRYVDLDTRHFTGNYPPRASLEASNTGDPLDAGASWTELLPVTDLAGNQHNFFPVHQDDSWQYLRLNIFPDGGIARLRVYGEIRPDWAAVGDETVLDLFAIDNGGAAIACNDQHFGNIRNLNKPGRGKDMGDGWETRRRREPGFDWVIVRLGHPGHIRRVEVDTAHFRGNYPGQVSMNASLVSAVDGTSVDDLSEASMEWPVLLPPQSVGPDAEHAFAGELTDPGPVSHVRINLHPDGGVSRVRIHGTVART